MSYYIILRGPLGSGKTTIAAKLAERLDEESFVMKPGSRYEMIDADDWHYVAPIDDPAITLMVTGKPWDRSAPKSSKPLVSLTEEARSEIFALFRKQFPLLT